MKITQNIVPVAATLFLALAISGCSAPADENDASSSGDPVSTNSSADTSEQGGEQASEQAGSDGQSGEPDAPAEMPVMTKTAWRVQGENGAVYTTFFDDDGTYRDFKNGDPMQNGTWEERVDGKLCFIPAKEGRIGECWELSPLKDGDIMRPVNDDGKTIELRKVTYIAPEEAS